MKRFTRMAGVLGMIAALAVPAVAQAQPISSTTTGSGGCTHTDKDGYDIPIDDGQTVFVDGKLVTCKDGTIVITTAPRTKPGTKKPVKRFVAVKGKVKLVTVRA